MSEKRRVNKIIAAGAAVLLFVVICLIAYFVKYYGKTDPADMPMAVSFVDVGQGDCELIQCEGFNVLIDGGEAEYAEKVAVYLRQRGVEKIDCYILTHPHTDHIGVSAYILEHFETAKILLTDFSEFNMPTTKAYETMLEAADSSGAEVTAVKAGDTFRYGPLSLDILSPAEETDDYNDMSVVVRAEYKSSRFLFMGDASSAVEEQLLAEKTVVFADVIKIAHHGSNTASSDKFIKTVAPEFAVISCGRNNQFGHPSSETLNVLKKNEVELFRTDTGGTIVLYSNGRKIVTG